MATSFGKWVEEKRMTRGWSQAELARKLGNGYTRDRVWELENGRPKNPTPELVKAITKALDCPIAEALETLGYEIPQTPGSRINPDLIESLQEVPYSVQGRLADVLPAILKLASGLSEETASKDAAPSKWRGNHAQRTLGQGEPRPTPGETMG